jgi:hypothetical protein
LEEQTFRSSSISQPSSAHSQHITPFFFRHDGNVTSAMPAWHVDGFLEVRLLNELHELCAQKDGEHYMQLELVNARLLADALTIFDRFSAASYLKHSFSEPPLPPPPRRTKGAS